MVAWLLPGDIWAQAAVSPEHAPSEHRAQHSAHTGVTRTRSYPQCSAAPATLTVRTVTHSRAHTNIFSKVNIFFVFTKYFLYSPNIFLCLLNIFLCLQNIFVTPCCLRRLSDARQPDAAARGGGCGRGTAAPPLPPPPPGRGRGGGRGRGRRGGGDAARAGDQHPELARHLPQQVPRAGAGRGRT